VGNSIHNHQAFGFIAILWDNKSTTPIVPHILFKSNYNLTHIPGVDVRVFLSFHLHYRTDQDQWLQLPCIQEYQGI
jgi:hypothetical protein